jgi:hypothetical protein
MHHTWADVAWSAIAAVPGAVAALIAWRNRRSLRTNGGGHIGEQVDRLTVLADVLGPHGVEMADERTTSKARALLRSLPDDKPPAA